MRVHDGRERALLAILDRAIRSGEHEVTLTSGDIERLEKAARERGAPPPLPDALAVCATLAARSSEELRQGNFRVLFENAQGPSGATLLGRFCHGDEELQQAVERHLRAEEALQPDAIFVEVAHLPEGRLGNVLLRPALRRHEIPYLAASGAAPEDRIPVQDLLVSVVGDEVRLSLGAARQARAPAPHLGPQLLEERGRLSGSCAPSRRRSESRGAGERSKGRPSCLGSQSGGSSWHAPAGSSTATS